MTAQHIANLEPIRRTAILVAQVASLEVRIADVTLAMFDKYTGSLFVKARNRDERRFQATKRDVVRTLLLFRRTIDALKQASETGEEGVCAVEREIGFRRLEAALPVIDSVSDVAEQDILVTAAERYGAIRRFPPQLLNAFVFRSNVPHDPLLAAIELIRTLNRGGCKILRRPPAAFLPARWRRLIFANAQPDRRLYEVAVLATLRERLRGSNIWVDGSRDWRAFEDHLLPKDEAGLAGIGGEADPASYVAARASMLHDQLTLVAACAERGELDGVEIEEGRLYIARMKPSVPDAARPLASQLYGMLSRALHRSPGRRRRLE